MERVVVVGGRRATVRHARGGVAVWCGVVWCGVLLSLHGRANSTYVPLVQTRVGAQCEAQARMQVRERERASGAKGGVGAVLACAAAGAVMACNFALSCHSLPPSSVLPCRRPPAPATGWCRAPTGSRIRPPGCRPSARPRSSPRKCRCSPGGEPTESGGDGWGWWARGMRSRWARGEAGRCGKQKSGER